MTIKLSGTEGISSIDGTVSNPSIKSISYGNTSGVFFPSTNTVGIATSGVQAIAIAADQKVGIGTSSPAYTLDVSGNARVTGDIIPSSQFSNRNRLINGDMRINQRAASYTISNMIMGGNVLSYTLDRWAGSTGPNALGATVNVTRQNTNNRYFMRFNHASGTLSSGYGYVTQVIESTNCLDLAGKSVTLSFKLRKGSTYIGTVLPIIWTGTTVDEGSIKMVTGTWAGYQQIYGTEILNSQITTSDFTTFTRTFNIASNVNEIAVTINPRNLTGTGSATNYLDITDVQLEIGSNATPFERLPFQMQVQACQRYYSKSADLDGYLVNGGDINSSNLYVSGTLNSWTAGAGYPCSMNFPVTMRIRPSVTFYRTKLSTQGAAGYNAPGYAVGTTKDGSWEVYDPAVGWASAYLTTLQTLTQTQFCALLLNQPYATDPSINTGGYLNWSAGPRLFYGGWAADAEM